jgi:hypothetical protein
MHVVAVRQRGLAGALHAVVARLVRGGLGADSYQTLAAVVGKDGLGRSNTADGWMIINHSKEGASEETPLQASHCVHE